MKLSELIINRFDQNNAVILSTLAHFLTTFDFSPHYWTTETTHNPQRYWQKKLVQKPIIKLQTPHDPQNFTKL